jgi:hypothetical protein
LGAVDFAWFLSQLVAAELGGLTTSIIRYSYLIYINKADVAKR